MAYSRDQIMAAIKIQESNGNYTAQNPTSSASGAYQYIDGTWANYGGYAHAWQAPPAVQDQRMRQDLDAAYKRYGGDWERVIAGHFTGDGSGDKSQWNYHPGNPSNHNPTVRSYVDSVMGHISGGSGGSAPASSSSGGGAVTAPVADDADYGYIADLAGAIPELKAILDRAKNDPQGQWTPERFQHAVQDSHWWKTTADTRRQAQVLMRTDPATYKQQVAQAAASLRDMALQMGVQGINYGQMAARSIQFGLSEAQLKDYLSAHWSSKGGSHGVAAQYKMKLTEMAKQYGIGVSNEWLDRGTRRMLAGDETIDTYNLVLRKLAKSKYVGLADEIDRGMTVAEVAQPYMAMKSQILEVPQTQVSLGDQDIQRALTYRRAGEHPAPMQLWEYEQDVKKNPLYDRTKGAVQSTYNMLGEIGKGWGFVG